MRNHNLDKSLELYLDEPRACPYLPNKSSVTAFVDPSLSFSMEMYGALINLGFRRSGSYIYRPYCTDCQACTSVRLPVADFQISRSQRRTVQRHQDTTVKRVKSGYHSAHFELYRLYLSRRHSDSDMSETSETQYLEFLTSHWCHTVFYEFYRDTQLFAVSVVDVLPTGLSAVYTFFDPAFSKFSPGQYAILWLIQEATKLALPWVYLGYWVEDCQKMSYKSNYRPIEAFIAQEWLKFPRNMDISL